MNRKKKLYCLFSKSFTHQKFSLMMTNMSTLFSFSFCMDANFGKAYDSEIFSLQNLSFYIGPGRKIWI